MSIPHITYIDEIDLRNKRILLRVDFNVSLNPNNMTIADDARIRQALPTINYLIAKGNRLVLASHLGRPKVSRDPKYSMQIVCDQLKQYVPAMRINLVDDFLTENPSRFVDQKQDEILMLENTRYYDGEKKNDPEFAQKMAATAEVFVNDAFGVAHRSDASVVGVTKFLPSYGGLLLKKEITMLSKVMEHPDKPVLSIVGGTKIETKINVIDRLIELSNYIVIGGGLANTFLYAKGFDVGSSFAEKEEKEKALALIKKADEKGVLLILPSDCVTGNPQEMEKGGVVYKIDKVPATEQILDIGPESKAKIGAIIAKSKTIIWNGPVGYFENPHFRQGTDFIYYAITNNEDAISVVGGGDTLAAISKKEYLDKITHISTGGGAMLEFIEKGTLPGIEALKK